MRVFKAIKVEEIDKRIIRLRDDIHREKNSIEKRRLSQEQASLIAVKRIMPHHSMVDHRRS